MKEAREIYFQSVPFSIEEGFRWQNLARHARGAMPRNLNYEYLFRHVEWAMLKNWS